MPRDDVVDVEALLLGRDLRVQHDLEQDVAELVGELGVVARLDRSDRLVGLFDHVTAQRQVVLRAVPRTAVGTAQYRDEPHELVEPAGRLDAGRRDVDRRVLAHVHSASVPTVRSVSENAFVGTAGDDDAVIGWVARRQLLGRLAREQRVAHAGHDQMAAPRSDARTRGCGRRRCPGRP